MSKRVFPSDLLEQAILIQDAWIRIDEQMIFLNLSMPQLVTDINQLQQTEAELLSAVNHLRELRRRRFLLQRSTWDKIKRVRAGVKSFFGDDSAQYEMVGGTPISERKNPRRTAQPAQPTE